MSRPALIPYALALAVILGAPDINQADGDGWTPLHGAAFMACQEAIGFLIDKGADPNRRNRLGQSPWNIAVEHKRTGVPEFLASRGADQSAPRFPAHTGDYFGQPPGRGPVVPRRSTGCGSSNGPPAAAGASPATTAPACMCRRRATATCT